MVELHGTYTLADFARFQYFYLFRRVWLLVFLLLVVMVALLAMTIAFPSGNPAGNVRPLVFLVTLWLVLLAILPYTNARLTLSRQPYFRQPMTQTFTATGYQLKGAGFSSDVSWSLLRAVRETKSLFLLYHTPKLAMIVPKRFFATDAERKAWKELVSAGIAPKTIARSGVAGRWF